MAGSASSRPIQVVSRADWGARPPRSFTHIRAVRGLAVHYTAMDADEQQDHANCASRVRGIQQYHQDAKGWADFAYSWAVCKHGVVFEGRGAEARTAANFSDVGNGHYLAVVFLGDDSEGRDDVTDAGRSALQYVRGLTAARWPGAWELVPHSKFKPTSCPGDELRAWIAAQHSDGDGDQEVDNVEQRYLDAIARTDAATDALPNIEHGVAVLNEILLGFLKIAEKEHPELVADVRRRIDAIPVRETR